MATAAPAQGDLVTGLLFEIGDGTIVLALRGTDYRLHLAVSGPVTAAVNKPITGRITVAARRVDVVGRGGRYIEPIYGRPRRLQGTVIDTDAAANTITVRCGGGCPFLCRLMANQKAGQFSIGQMVALDAEPGARFEITAPT
jgi:hypothetical protein